MVCRMQNVLKGGKYLEVIVEIYKVDFLSQKKVRNLNVNINFYGYIVDCCFFKGIGGKVMVFGFKNELYLFMCFFFYLIDI